VALSSGNPETVSETVYSILLDPAPVISMGYGAIQVKFRSPTPSTGGKIPLWTPKISTGYTHFSFSESLGYKLRVTFFPVTLHSPCLGEKRFLAMGRIYNKIWTVVFTPRSGEIRIISARRAREEEVAYYEKHKAS